MRLTESGIVKLEPSASDTHIKDMGESYEYAYELVADVQIINPDNHLITQQFVIYFNDDMSLGLDDALSVIKNDKFSGFPFFRRTDFTAVRQNTRNCGTDLQDTSTSMPDCVAKRVIIF